MPDTKMNLAQYIGRKVKCEDGSVQVITELAHSYRWPNKFVVNNNHFVHYLEFFGQMNGEKITDEDRKLFKEAFEELDGKETGTKKLKFEN